MTFVENSPYRKQLAVQMMAAKRLLEYLCYLERLKKLAQARSDILNLDHMTIAEIKSYSHPPVPVHLVMLATCVLMGEDEDYMQVCHLIGSPMNVYIPYTKVFILPYSVLLY